MAEEKEVTAAEESMEDYKEELEASFRKINVGDILTGKVIEAGENGVLVDLNYYAPGKIALEDLSSDPGFSVFEDIHVGDEISATVVKLDDGAGNLVLSRREADDVLAWDKLKQMMEEHTVVSGKITETVKGGAVMFVEGVRGFIPASKLALHYVEDTSGYLNQEIEANIIEVDEEKKRLILSCRDILVQKALEEKAEKVKGVAVGSIVEGTVEQLKDYGAFVDIGDGITGLLHVSQISDKRIAHPKAVLKVGQKVKVKITKAENGRVSLSMKALQDVTEKEPENHFHYKEDGQATTGLGALLKGLKLD